MSWTGDLLTGLAVALDTAGVATWRPDTPYTAGQLAIVLGPIPQSPDRVLALTAYGVSDDPGLADVIQGVQVRSRGTADPRSADELAEAVYDALHGASMLRLGAIPVTQIIRASWAPLGQDERDRYERSDNYYVYATRPTSSRPD